MQVNQHSLYGINAQGFSLIEVVIALGAFGLLAVLMQSVLIMGHSFQISQQRIMDMTQAAQMLKQTICQANTSFKQVNMNIPRTYTIQTNTNEAREYISNDISINSSVPFLILDMTNLEHAGKPIESDVNHIIKEQQAIDPSLEFSNNRQLESNKSTLYYKVFQDSHTIVKINIHDEAFMTKKQVNAYIFAARCVENDEKSVLHTKDGLGEKAVKKTALYILEQKVRPYYFPPSLLNKKPSVLCYSGNPNKGGKEKKDWLPRIYIIHIVSSVNPEYWISNNLPASHHEHIQGVFIAEPKYIQQEPQWHEINNIWGASFIISTNTSLQLNQSIAFKLELFFLKNNCITSAARSANCPYLKIGTDLSKLKIPMSSYYMQDFIYTDVSMCSGYSSTLGSSTLIGL